MTNLELLLTATLRVLDPQDPQGAFHSEFKRWCLPQKINKDQGSLSDSSFWTIGLRVWDDIRAKTLRAPNHWKSRTSSHRVSVHSHKPANDSEWMRAVYFSSTGDWHRAPMHSGYSSPKKVQYFSDFRISLFFLNGKQLSEANGRYKQLSAP